MSLENNSKEYEMFSNIIKVKIKIIFLVYFIDSKNFNFWWDFKNKQGYEIY